MIRGMGTVLPRYFSKFAPATGRAIATLFKQGGGKSGQQRAMYRLRAGVITARAPDTDSATENNLPFVDAIVRPACTKASAGE